MFLGLILKPLALFSIIYDKIYLILVFFGKSLIDFLYENVNKILDILFDDPLVENKDEEVLAKEPLLLTIIPEQVKEQSKEVKEVSEDTVFYDDFKYMPAYRVELFMQDLKAYFLKYKVDAEFAHFIFCVNPPKGSREAQRAESLWRKNKNALPEFAHLFASYPEIGEHALSELITKDKKYIAEWFSAKLFTFSDKGKRVYV